MNCCENIVKFDPAIRWSGSKRSQMNEIVSRFPKDIDIYFEPFCGGASVMRCMLESGIKPNHIICSDINKDLINLWNIIKDNPEKLLDGYKELWNTISNCKTDTDKAKFFNEIRDRYNKNHSPIDFFFLQRTSINGLIRHNKYGNYNAAFHHGRNGINPKRLDSIINEWSEILNKNHVVFVNQSYDDILPSEYDFVYFDPPYANTGGLYYGAIDFNKFFEFLRNLKCKYILSFDGKVGDESKEYDVPKDIYIKHELLYSGKSGFRKYNNDNRVVFESIYLNY